MTAWLLGGTPAWAEDPHMGAQQGVTLPPVAGSPPASAAHPQGEVIQIWDERPEKPYNRDTEVRLTGAQLAAMGATDLASALALLPDVKVFDAGRGGVQVEIRGARRGVRILIDGVLVNDPFYGQFDVASVPITDIAQIRVSTSPAAPMDGPGGPGGVIEIHTRDAWGPTAGVVRLGMDSLPSASASATGHAHIADAWALRLSAGGLVGAHEYVTAAGASVPEDRRAVSAAARLEHRRYHGGKLRRMAIDAAYDGRGYLAPPSDELATALFLRIRDQRSVRMGVQLDDRIGGTQPVQLLARAWWQQYGRGSDNFRDAALMTLANREDLSSTRAGAHVLFTRPWRGAAAAAKTATTATTGTAARWVASIGIDHERANVATTVVSAQASAPAPSAAGTTTRVQGQATVAGVAVGAQYDRGAWAADASVGAAVPFNANVAPWPEAKLAATWRPSARISLQAIGARKGRIPTLRERYQGQSANIDLGPEQAWHAELIARWQRAWLEVSAAPYGRFTTGTVKVGADNILENLGALRVLGADVRAVVKPCRGCELGGAYLWAKAHSDDAGADPIDRFPAHRAEAWGKLTRGAVAATLRGRYYGQSIDRTEAVGAYGLWEITTSWRAHSQWLISARVDDLLDARPETRDGYRAPGRTVWLALTAYR